MPKRVPAAQCMILILSFVPAGCRTRVAVTPPPVVNLQEVVTQGDAWFEKSHLYGWRQAEPLYRKAYGLWASDAIKDKLLLTQFLILTRQADEDIVDSTMENDFRQLCSGRVNARQKALCDLAVRYKGKNETRPTGLEGSPDPCPFDAESSALEAYLYTLYADAYGIKETNETAGARAEKFKDSPLFVYLYLGKKNAQRATEFQKTLPDFAELFDFIGGLDFERTKYKSARSQFNRALELIPDYTRSRNGLGNIDLFALEDHQAALEHYRLSLRFDPGNAAALFGTGLVLHHLGRYADSISCLDKMLQSDLSRGGHNSEEAVRYYQGEANYYIAYNSHLSGNSGKAREYIEIAKRYLPAAEHINYLSGLLHYQGGNLQAAKGDFMKVMQVGATNCDAQYYLGRIYREMKEEPVEQPAEQTAGIKVPERLAEYLKEVPLDREPRDKRSLNYFLAACSCMESSSRSIEGQIRSVAVMDLDDSDKVLLQGRLQQKLGSYRQASGFLIDTMIHLASTSEYEGKDDYLNLMKEMRGRVAATDVPAGSSSGSP